jgi:hypothetical protein
VLSTRVPTKLFLRADQLRQKAREEEKIRAQLEEKRKLAESEGRTMEALALKIQVREMDAEAYKLHEKAARRYFVGKFNLRFFRCGQLLLSDVSILYSSQSRRPVPQD